MSNTILTNLDMYNELTVYGESYPTEHMMSDVDKFITWSEENFEYIKYNPRKDIRRYGLSITSLDGGVTGIPDLDSLSEYNADNNSHYKETDFNVHTPVYYYPELQKVLDQIKYDICRTHVLKIEPGGYFPPHRDFVKNHFNSFRLIIPLQNFNPPLTTFIIGDKIQYWEKGHVYFIDTAKMHYLFNASFSPSYWIVINAILNRNTVDYVTSNMLYQ